MVMEVAMAMAVESSYRTARTHKVTHVLNYTNDRDISFSAECDFFPNIEKCNFLRCRDNDGTRYIDVLQIVGDGNMLIRCTGWSCSDGDGDGDGVGNGDGDGKEAWTEMMKYHQQ